MAHGVVFLVVQGGGSCRIGHLRYAKSARQRRGGLARRRRARAQARALRGVRLRGRRAGDQADQASERASERHLQNMMRTPK